MQELTPELLQGIPKNGPTDPIEYYSRPFVGALFRERINRGLRLIPNRTYSRALEVGYGSGGLLLSLSHLTKDLHGIDLDANPESVRAMLAARGCRAALIQGSVLALPYENNSFELIVCFSVFEHLTEYKRALAEVRRVLAPGGCFLLGMPTVSPLMTRLFEAIGHNTIDDIHITTPRMICDAFAPIGFRLAASSFLDIPMRRPFGLRLYHNWLLTK